jgi:hypothetical protein
MTIEAFLSFCDSDTLPNALTPLLKALWLDRRGEWERAHAEIQDGSDPQSAAIHAYLHRKEGDHWNARYWYNQAKRRPFDGSFEKEWRDLAEEFCSVSTQALSA